MNRDDLDENLNRVLTQIELAMDELLDVDTAESRKAEHLLLGASIELAGLIDALDDEADLISPGG